MHTPRARKLSAIGTIAATAATFGLCGWAVVQDEAENRAVHEQAVATYDPGKTWGGGDTR